MIKQVTDIDSEWPVAFVQLSRVVDRFDLGYGLDTIKERLNDGTNALWRVHGKAYVLTSVKAMEDFNVLDCLMCAGEDSNSWLGDWFDYIDEYAKHYKCKYIEVTGRKGWVRQLRKHDFKEYCTTVRKSL